MTLYAVSGVVAVVWGTALYSTFSTRFDEAAAYQRAPLCADAETSTDCLQTSTASISDHHYTVSSKGSHTYYVTLTSFDGFVLTSSVSSSEYDALTVGSAVNIRLWHGVPVLMQLPNGAYVGTSLNPTQKLQGATIGLFIPNYGFLVILCALFLTLSARGPDDVIRDTVTYYTSAPREVPSGLLAATLAWRSAWVLLSGGIVMFCVLAFLALQAANNLALVQAAPSYGAAAMTAAAALTLYLLQRRVVRDLRDGVAGPFVIENEAVVRGRYGPVGVRIRYSLSDGSQKSFVLRKRWWRMAPIGSELFVLRSPIDGRIWRVIGLSSGGQLIP